MSISVFQKLVYCDFDVRNIEVYHISFTNKTEIDYRAHGRNKHLLHFSLCGERYYKTETQEFVIGNNEIVFIPDSTKYLTYALNTDCTPCVGINICFDICENDGNKLNFEKMIYWLKNINTTALREHFIEIDTLWNVDSTNILSLKTQLYNIVCDIINDSQCKSKEYLNIKKALDHINAHFNENLPIRFYADLCGYSESYFRKRFKSLIGVSIIEYRNKLRFSEAKRLYQENLTLQEIAEKIGFYDSCHFSKQYKKQKGISFAADNRNK